HEQGQRGIVARKRNRRMDNVAFSRLALQCATTFDRSTNAPHGPDQSAAAKHNGGGRNKYQQPTADAQRKLCRIGLHELRGDNDRQQKCPQQKQRTAKKGFPQTADKIRARSALATLLFDKAKKSSHHAAPRRVLYRNAVHASAHTPARALPLS